jgi:hypothetical protein
MLRHSSSSGRSTGRGFSWPAYMDRTLLQQAMKRGQLFRCVLTNALHMPRGCGWPVGIEACMHTCGLGICAACI